MTHAVPLRPPAPAVCTQPKRPAPPPQSAQATCAQPKPAAATHPPKVVHRLRTRYKAVAEQDNGSKKGHPPALVKAHRLPHQPATANLAQAGGKEQSQRQDDLRATGGMQARGARVAWYGGAGNVPVIVWALAALEVLASAWLPGQGP